MIERMVLVMGIAMLATLAATGAIFAPLTGTPWLDALLAPGIVIAATAALGALIALAGAIMQRADPIWAAGGAVTVDDDHNLTLSTKRFLRAPEPTATVRLDQVTVATWYISPFSRSGTLSIQLWDHDPEITFGIFGLMPQSGTEPLADISTRILDASPTAAARLQHYLEQRIDAGTLECNFTPHDFEPIPELRPPLEPGITFSADGREIRYRKPDPDETP
ncbi:hypothetical protein Mlaev_02426 [Microbacterium laevaniformans]|uniref:Uncharacterized protein n=1 Tax=Microbacterium laevaniformans TaxID=36807 RepID=A0A150H9E4_9MICO|nr:hypothetical protein [Microbacterium laevaniformans]KXZ58723.1 hypothetical protein Mlaev_02426 [Microbacterium laevaniformans]